MKAMCQWLRNRIGGLARGNKGFSMIEIIIVIAVMGILASSAFSLSNYLKYADIQKAVKNVENQINKLQVSAMTKKTKQEINIYTLANGESYMKIGKAPMLMDNAGIKLSNGAMVIQGVDAAGNTFTATDTNPIKLKYQRSGVFSTDTNVNQIVIKGKTTTYTIKILKNTGKIKVEK